MLANSCSHVISVLVGCVAASYTGGTETTTATMFLLCKLARAHRPMPTSMVMSRLVPADLYSRGWDLFSGNYREGFGRLRGTDNPSTHTHTRARARTHTHSDSSLQYIRVYLLATDSSRWTSVVDCNSKSVHESVSINYQKVLRVVSVAATLQRTSTKIRIFAIRLLPTPQDFGSIASSHYVDQVSNTPDVPTAQKGV